MEGKIQKGNTLLITGANSGLASVMIRMAKAFGIRVIGTVRSKEKAESIQNWGADVIVNTSEQKLNDALKAELEKGHGVDVAIDCIGGEIMGDCLPYLNRGARWIMIAALGGIHTSIDLKNIYVKNIRIIGSTLRSRDPAVKAEILSKLVAEVWPLVEEGKILPTIFKTLPIAQAEEAQDFLMQGKSVGKVVLTVSH